MTKLNIGCGNRYLPGWENLDFRPVSPDVKAWDLRKPLPYADGTVDLVYSSHLLEHLSPEQAEALLKDSLRVLKPGGVVRVVVPDLEALAREYLEEVAGCRLQVAGDIRGRRAEDLGETADRRPQTTDSKNSPQRAQRTQRDSEDPDTFEDKPSTFNLQPSTLLERYDWSVIFLIDQLCRTQTGGRMLAKLAEYEDDPPDFLKDHFNEEWQESVLGKVESRKSKVEIGIEDRGQRTEDGDLRSEISGRRSEIGSVHALESEATWDGSKEPRTRNQEPDAQGLQSSVFSLQSGIRRIALALRWRWRVVMKAFERALRQCCPGMADRLDCWRTARYLAQGERHQWMYDEISLGRLLAECGFVNVKRMTEGTSLSPFEDDLRRLDMTASGEAYQPSSLYVEGGKGDDGLSGVALAKTEGRRARFNAQHPTSNAQQPSKFNRQQTTAPGFVLHDYAGRS